MSERKRKKCVCFYSFKQIFLSFMTFMVLIEFLLTWRHGHLTLIKKWAFQKIYCVIHPVPSPVIRSYKCSLLQLNWIVRNTNFFFHKNKNQMNHQTILTPMTSSFLQRVLFLSFSLSLSTTFAKTLFNLIDFQGATLLFRYHSSFRFRFLLHVEIFCRNSDSERSSINLNRTTCQNKT